MRVLVKRKFSNLLLCLHFHYGIIHAIYKSPATVHSIVSLASSSAVQYSSLPVLVHQ